MRRADVTVPAQVARWLDARHGPWHVVAAASWPRAGSQVWRLQVRGSGAYLKVSPNEESFHRERSALTEMLPRTSVPTQTLLDADSALRVLLTAALDGDVVRTLDPPPPAHTEQTIHAQAGAALRAVHGLVRCDDQDAAERVRAERASFLVSRAQDDLAVCRALLSPDEVGAVALAERSFLDASRDGELGYVHGDFQPRNWLWDAAAGRTALIDFEEATAGFVVEDLGWLFATTWPSRRDLAGAFLGGYGRPLTASEQVCLAAGTVLGSLGHVADGERLGVAKKVADGLGGLRAGSAALARMLAAAASDVT
ncbi:MAG: aminoglycoside phosphotransferase family protein [Cellulomonas sp.]|uniref:phosphotransferase family protein n=1 Tax=Cellulomonas sp. TaxID=40001 RepID=UPI0019F61DC4|nr:aminoglycoside phosphotransferase family protein [Cellulomonas sp.]MBF0689298.1 aminoglycoside phosphotransferase family protein [Cellulomonas sp.]